MTTHNIVDILEGYNHCHKFFSERLKHMFDTTDYFNRLDDEENAWLLSYGWPPLMHARASAARQLRQYCNGMDSTTTQKEINESILGFYVPDRIHNEILKLWETKPFLSNRIHILRSAIEAHNNSNYTLSIPTLLPQLEGIIADTFKHKGYMNERAYRKYLNQIMPEGKHGSDRYFNKLVFDYILMHFIHGQPIVFDLNRHAILHGADVNYANPMTSLKAILIIDFIIDQIKFVSLEQSDIYHRIECQIVNQSQESRKVYSWESDAKKDGKEPCGKCCIDKK
ncbi:MAG: hypothetical protein MUP16_10960 [Sedimentisphaerales bacterium]|nr:hypothetical protein [Sedimentisphaerales bacterium]